MRAEDRIIIALDVASPAEALALVKQLRGRVGLFKVGSQLFTAAGPPVVAGILQLGERVFLDLKFHDIPNTAAQAARAARAMGVSMITVHAGGGAAMLAAVMGALQAAPAQPKPPLVLAVTLLTSLASSDLEHLGVAGSPEDQVLRLAGMAMEAGVDGLVASPAEVGRLRRRFGSSTLLVTPGIRPAGTALHDQSRAATPQEALRAGSDYLVIGRPVTASPNPLRSLNRIIETIRGETWQGRASDRQATEKEINEGAR